MQFRADWTYLDTPNERVRRLLASPVYSEIVAQLVAGIDPANVEHCIECGKDQELAGALRPVFFVPVEPSIADLSFNGPCGYRAQYYRSPINGEQANRLLLFKAEEMQLAAANREIELRKQQSGPDPSPSMTLKDTTRSIRLQSAKVWGDESRGDLCKMVKCGNDVSAKINASRWMNHARQQHPKAEWGVCAPEISRLKIFGAFVRGGIELVPTSKLARSLEIFEFGFS